MAGGPRRGGRVRQWRRETRYTYYTRREGHGESSLTGGGGGGGVVTVVVVVVVS